MADNTGWKEELGLNGDVGFYVEEGEKLLKQNKLEEAASAYDRAFCIAPNDSRIIKQRKEILDSLSLNEFGIEFRYIPAGAFLMGSEKGEPDEGPPHPVYLSPFWIAEVPISWETCCEIFGWNPPPDGLPERDDKTPLGEEYWGLFESNKLRLQYCEDETTSAQEWHSHTPPFECADEDPPRCNPKAPAGYGKKPNVAVGWWDGLELCKKISNKKVVYSLPSEAEWEKAARGGLHGKRFPWGDEPARDRADWDRFREYSIKPSKTFAPNSYGLYAMTGGVWEWVEDWYDAEYYTESSFKNPAGPEPKTAKEKILRGGSWADCIEACTVSFRMARGIGKQAEDKWYGSGSPNVGLRICRKAQYPQ
ncbi:MAG: formylglycine-generating enzyme family protein [bacterium]|nr:formylglycine-generating enzyme family protein [bacterium]